jgi:peptidoglycan L-alanyl-D-glutamate endopeptidase CwlK
LISADELEVIRKLGLTFYPEHVFGPYSKKNLAGVFPPLIMVAELAIAICEFDGKVEPQGGTRTKAQAAANAKSGVGIKNSRHLRQPDGYGHAIDLIPLVPGRGVVWDDLTSHRAMAAAVKTASAILSIPVRQGNDWNMNGVVGQPKEYDWDHFEDPIPGLQEAAKAEMLRWRRALGLDRIDAVGNLSHDQDSLPAPVPIRPG